MQTVRWPYILVIVSAALLSPAAWRDGLAVAASFEPAESLETGTDNVQIPFTISRNKIILRARAGQSPELKLILDTGMPSDGLLLYKRGLKDSLGVDRFADAEIGGAGSGGSSGAVVAESVSVSVGDLMLADQRVIVLQSDMLSAFPSDGVIGYSLFGHYAVEIDYDDMLIKLHESHAVAADSSWGWIPIFFKDNKIPWIEAAINVTGEKTAPILLYIDLASSEALELLIRDRMSFELPDSLTDYYLGRGLSGDIYGQKGRIKLLRLGPYTLNDVDAAFAPAEIRSRQSGADGVLSNNALRRFNVLFDYAGKKLYLKPNSYFAEPFD